jgi:repressor LexA
MIEDHIDDGDYVVIKGQETARNGERVVAMVDGEVTLKKFQKTKDLITLQPANESIKPIEVRPGADIKILGVLVGVLRKC